jgi:hypothetical protein
MPSLVVRSRKAAILDLLSVTMPLSTVPNFLELVELQENSAALSWAIMKKAPYLQDAA